MADKTTMAAYNKTGFAGAAGTAPLQEQASQIKTDDVSLRQQAEAQYKPTYEAEKRSLTTQLSALIKSQTDDSDLLNTQYQKSVNTMMGKLAQRGLNTGGLPQTTTAALDKFRNEVMAQRQTMYNVQQQGIKNLQDTLEGNYELNIQARMYDNRNSALDSLNDILTQMAKLQASSFEDYIKFLLNKKQKSSGGGSRRSSGRRYYSSGRSSSSSSVSTTNASSGISADYFGGSGSGNIGQSLKVETKPVTTTKRQGSSGGGKRVLMTR